MNSEKPQTRSPLDNISNIIAISSCKGGVGKSTVAAHLASELASRGLKVGIVDTDIHGPSIPSLFNIKNVSITQNEFKQLIPIEKNNLKIMSFGFLLGDAPAIFRGPIVTRYVQQVLLNTDWGKLDYLLIDMPPGTGDVQLTITQSIRLNGAIIVTTPQSLSLIDVARGILMFEKVNVPILGIIENMAYFECDDCSKKHYIFGETNLNQRFGTNTLAQLPLLPQMTHAIEKPLGNTYIMQAVDDLEKIITEDSINTLPPKIYCDEKQTTLTWEGEESISISNRDLRLSCRCAYCANEITGEVMIKEEDLPKDIHPKKITPLGNYAIGIDWSDGHSSGIYPYESIKNLTRIKL